MMTTSDSANLDDDELDERSFTRPRIPRRHAVLATVGICALAGLAGWIGWGQASQPVRWQDVGFEVSSESLAFVTYDVYLYSDRGVTCHLRALNNRFVEVGVATQQVDPALGSEQRFATPIITIQEATTAVVSFCEPDPTE